MFDRRHVERWIACATLYVAKFGLSVLPMGGNKKPLIKWLDLQQRRPSIRELLGWPKENLAIITGAVSNLVVVDCESREDAEWFHRNRGQSPVVVQSRRGYHFYFRHPGVRIANAQKITEDGTPFRKGGLARYDVRGDGGYVLAPPSRHNAGAYRWHKLLIETDKLPIFRSEWRPEQTQLGKSEREIHDAEKYIARIRAVSGQNGHNETFRAACVLKDSGLSESEALLALQSWNRTNADPPWSDGELLHKIKSAYA